MLTVNGVTRGPRDYSFSFSELKAEATRRGIQLPEPVTKGNLINALITKERILQRKDFVVYGTRNNELVMRDLSTFDSIYSQGALKSEFKKAVGFYPYVVGVTPSGEIVTLESTKTLQIVLRLRIFNSKLELLREKHITDEGVLLMRTSTVPQLTGNKLIFVDHIDAKREVQVIKVVNVKTLEVKILPDSEGQYFMISAKDNYLLAHNQRKCALTLWDLETETIKVEVGGRDIEDIQVDYLFLIDPKHFCVSSEERTEVYTLKSGKWIKNPVVGGNGYGVCDGKLVTAVNNAGINVFDISGETILFLFSVSVPFYYGEEPALITEMRESRVFVVVEDGFLVVDLERERVTNHMEATMVSDYYYFPPDETERREFLELIAGSVPSTVPTAVAGIIEKFI